MSESFSDKDQGFGGAKRPAPTIEGTATEVVSDSPQAGTSGTGAKSEETAKPEPEPATGDAQRSATKPKPVPPRPSPTELKGFVTHLAAGLLGGLVGVLALALSRGYLATDQAAAPPASDLTAIEQRLAKLESAPPSSVQGLGTLNQRIKLLEDRAPQSAPDLSDLTARMTKLEQTLQSLAETAKNGGSVADAAAVSNQIAEAEQRLQTKIDASLAVRETANTQALETVTGEIADLKTQIANLAQGAPGSSDSGLQQEIAGLTDRLAKAETALANLSGTVDQGAAEAKTAATSLAFANLRAAAIDGHPYQAELSALQALAPDLGDLGTLPKFAEHGIPTLAALKQSFAQARQASIAATPAPDDGSLLGGLIASAKTVVKVRRVDATATGDDPDAILARAEAKLNQGDLAGAAKEVESLSGATRDAFATWLDQAQARVAVPNTLSRLEQRLLQPASKHQNPQIEIK